MKRPKLISAHARAKHRKLSVKLLRPRKRGVA